MKEGLFALRLQIIHYHGQELAPTNLNDAIPRSFLESFEAAGLIDADRKQLLGLDIDIAKE